MPRSASHHPPPSPSQPTLTLSPCKKRLIRRSSPYSPSIQALRHEALLLYHLSSINIPGILPVLGHGLQNNRYVLITPALPTLVNLPFRTTPVPTYYLRLLALALLGTLQQLHEKNYLHNHIHPRNIHESQQRGGGQLSLFTFCLSNFSHSTPIGDTAEATPSSGSTSVSPPNLEFCSRNMHRRRYPLSQRDDLESLGYALLYLTHGRLPWSHFAREGRARDVYQLKARFMKGKPAAGFQGFGDFRRYFAEVEALKWYRKPNYTAFRDAVSNS